MQKLKARDCEIKEIEGKEYKDFVYSNHNQSYAAASKIYGLFYKKFCSQVIKCEECGGTNGRHKKGCSKYKKSRE